MRILLAALFAMFCLSHASAEIYKWTDKHGVVHYGDKRPEQSDNIPAAKVETVELSPIQILDDGSVRNTGKEDDSMLGQVLARVDEFRTIALEKIATWRGTAPVVANKPDSVEIYTTAWCGACKKAKHWLRERGVAFKEYDVQKDANAALRMRKLGGGGGVPFAVINGETIQGFNPAEYHAALR